MLWKNACLLLKLYFLENVYLMHGLYFCFSVLFSSSCNRTRRQLKTQQVYFLPLSKELWIQQKPDVYC